MYDVEPEPSDALGSHFRCSDAFEVGMKPSSLRGPKFEAPFRGVRKRREAQLTPAPLSSNASIQRSHSSRLHPLEVIRAQHIDDARSYALIAPEDSFFCGVTALAILGLPVRLAERQPIEVGRLHPARPSRAKNVRGFQIRAELTTVEMSSGFRVTDPVTTWGMLGRRMCLEELVVLGDAIVYTDRGRRLPLATALELAAGIVPGRAGSRTLRHAVELVRDGSASPPETQLRLALVAAGLGEPDIDVDVYDADGRLLGRSELAYRAEKVAVEYESDHHRSDVGQWNRDIEKYDAYVERGWRVVRVTARMLRGDPAEIASRVQAAVQAQNLA